MNERDPNPITVLFVFIIFASLAHMTISYVVTIKPRSVIQGALTPVVAKTARAARPQKPVADAIRRNDVTQVNQHATWCRKNGSCDLDKDLRLAAATSEPNIAKALLAAGARVNSQDKDNETPLHAAASGGRVGFAQVLLAAGADVNARDDEGFTPLHSAAAWGHVELMRVLLAAGADANAADARRQTPLHIVAGRRVPPLAVYADVTKILLEAGARPNLRAADGSTPLHLARQAASRLSLEGNLKATGDANEVVAMLRERGARE